MIRTLLLHGQEGGLQDAPRKTIQSCMDGGEGAPTPTQDTLHESVKTQPLLSKFDNFRAF